MVSAGRKKSCRQTFFVRPVLSACGSDGQEVLRSGLLGDGSAPPVFHGYMMRFGIAKSKNFVFHLSLHSPFRIFVKK